MVVSEVFVPCKLFSRLVSLPEGERPLGVAAIDPINGIISVTTFNWDVKCCTEIDTSKGGVRGVKLKIFDSKA
jgi:hypothetical protein